MVHIFYFAGISNTTFRRRCVVREQGYWWMLSLETDEFIDIGFHRGDLPLEIDVDVDDGRYMLGCGPKGKYGFRDVIEIKEGDIIWDKLVHWE